MLLSWAGLCNALILIVISSESSSLSGEERVQSWAYRSSTVDIGHKDVVCIGRFSKSSGNLRAGEEGSELAGNGLITWMAEEGNDT